MAPWTELFDYVKVNKHRNDYDNGFPVRRVGRDEKCWREIVN